jgi:transposase
MPLDSITKMLNIENQKVARIIQNRGRFECVLEPIVETRPVCAGCGRSHNTSIHCRSYVVIEDFPISGRRVFLHVRKRNIICSEDGRIRVEEFDWIKKKCTKRFVEHLTIRYISVDEVAWQKWHKYVTNIVDIEKRKVNWNHK